MNDLDNTGNLLLKKTKKDYSTLRCIILVYDFIRLLLLVKMVSVFAPAIGTPGDKVVPFVAFMAPHAIYSLAAFFLWINPKTYAVYTSLYVTGKIIGIGAFVAWAVMFSSLIISSIGMNLRETVWTLGLTVILLFADICTIIGVSALQKRIKE